MPFEQLMALLLEERDGILSWMLEGAHDFIQRGLRLDPPESVRWETEQYFTDEDTIGRFVKEWCRVVPVPHDVGDIEVRKFLQDNGSSATELHKAFTVFAQFGKYSWGKAKVTRRLQKVDGIIARRCTDNVTFLNLALSEHARKTVYEQAQVEVEFDVG